VLVHGGVSGWCRRGDRARRRPRRDDQPAERACRAAEPHRERGSGHDRLVVCLTNNLMGTQLPICSAFLWCFDCPYPAFCQTETCSRLSLVKGSRSQSLQRSRKVIPASRAIRSSSDGHT
jgi:hypothetical protein